MLELADDLCSAERDACHVAGLDLVEQLAVRRHGPLAGLLKYRYDEQHYHS
jgi:hypothetical protein